MWAFVIFTAILIFTSECDPLVFSSEYFVKGKIKHGPFFPRLPRFTKSAMPFHAHVVKGKKQVVLLLREAKHVHTECIHNCVWA